MVTRLQSVKGSFVQSPKGVFETAGGAAGTGLLNKFEYPQGVANFIANCLISVTTVNPTFTCKQLNFTNVVMPELPAASVLNMLFTGDISGQTFRLGDQGMTQECYLELAPSPLRYRAGWGLFSSNGFQWANIGHADYDTTYTVDYYANTGVPDSDQLNFDLWIDGETVTVTLT